MSGPHKGATPEELAVLRKFGFKADVAYVPVSEAVEVRLGDLALVSTLPEALVDADDWPEGIKRTGEEISFGIAFYPPLPPHQDIEGVRQAVLDGMPLTMVFDDGGEPVLLRRVVPCGECRWWTRFPPSLVNQTPSMSGECASSAFPFVPGREDYPHTDADFWCAGGKAQHEHHWCDVTMHDQADLHFVCDVGRCDATKLEPR